MTERMLGSGTAAAAEGFRPLDGYAPPDGFRLPDSFRSGGGGGNADLYQRAQLQVRLDLGRQPLA